jgi:uncharacterized Zn finger protein (UPF0148 family)
MDEGQLIKKCPKCGYINKDTAMVCTDCRASLTRINPEYYKPQRQEEAVKEPEASAPSDKSQHHEVAQKEDKTVRLNATYPKLIYESNQNFIAEIRDGSVVGRDGDINVSSLPRSQFISGRHATFIKRGDRWYLRNEPPTQDWGKNATRINLTDIPYGEMRPLNDYDRITLADTVFIFRSS